MQTSSKRPAISTCILNTFALNENKGEH